MNGFNWFGALALVARFEPPFHGRRLMQILLANGEDCYRTLDIILL